MGAGGGLQVGRARGAGAGGEVAGQRQEGAIEAAFAVEELYDGHHVTVGGLELRTRAVAHGMPAFAPRAEADGRSPAYSGDTAPCDALTELAAGCDLLVRGGDDTRGDTPGGPGAEPPVHHTPEEAGETAYAAGARAARHARRPAA